MDYEKLYNEAYERFKAFKAKYYTKGTYLGDVIFDKTGEMQKDFESIFPQPIESENERIRKALIEVLHRLPTSVFECGAEGGYLGATKEQMIAYLEKQKEYVSNNFDDVWNAEECAEIINEGEKLSPRFKEQFKEVCHAWYDKGIELEKQKEQKPAEHWQYVGEVDLKENREEEKPNIELIQKSWYMEGYHDRKFNNEPKWIIKTGEGGPRYEENPKYGQMLEAEQKPVEYLDKDKVYAIMKKLVKLAAFSQLIPINSEEYKMIDEITCDIHKLLDYPIEQKPTEKQDYSGLNELERAIHRGFLCAGVENVPVNIIKETAQDCLAHFPVEWSEDFDKEVENVHKRYPEVSFAKLTRIAYHFSKWANRCKDMEWSEEDEKIYTFVYDFFENCWWNTKWKISREQALKMLKSLRPSWKHSEDEERLINTSIAFLKDFADKGYENAAECIDWLKSKLNGNTCK